MSEQKRFYSLLDSFQSSVSDETSIQDLAKSLVDDFLAELQELNKSISNEDFQDGNASSLIKHTKKGMSDFVVQTQKKWSELIDRQKLAQQFNKKLIILVFGKVNSGKSSFSNHFVEQYEKCNPNHGTTYFYIEGGEKKTTNEAFAVGSTETTSRIQGVELGNLVLLDTPGLHSITNENGVLTRKYTDSADLVLWLTNSGSPGQIQELEELREELQKEKPLLPIITKSDTYEEDEVNGELVDELVMKPENDQKMQQQDVLDRTKKKVAEVTGGKVHLNTMLKPISISTHFAKEFPNMEEVFEQSGYYDLFCGLNSTFQDAVEYKVEKFNRQVKNYLNNIINMLQTELLDDVLSKTVNDLRNQRENLQEKLPVLVSQAKGKILAQLSDLIQKHESSKDVSALNAEIKTVVESVISKVMEDFVKQYFKTFNEAIQYSVDDTSEYENVTYSYERKTGAGGKAIGSVVGGLIGAVVAGPVGAVVGAMLGGGAGSVAERSETVTEEVGVDSSSLQASQEQALNNELPVIIEKALENVLNNLKLVEDELDKSIDLTRRFIEKVNKI